MRRKWRRAVAEHVWSTSDNASFWYDGYPAIMMVQDFDQFDPFWHTPEDTVSHFVWPYYVGAAKALLGTVACEAGLVTASATPTPTRAPAIASFTPTSGPVSTRVTVTGSDFSGTTSVKFNGTAATSFSVDSATQIIGIVPTGASTGAIAVTTPGGTATSSTRFTVIPAPTIGSFSPASGRVGASVTVTGTNLTGATAVKFNGAAASFTEDSATRITTTVPTAATSGRITVTTPGGTALSSNGFKVKPVLSTLSPTAGKRGATVTLVGTGFGARRGTSYVKFGTKKCGTYFSWSNTRIRCRVPAKAAFGRAYVRVTAAGGASNTKTFTVKR